jgi:DNA repair exonuclease SbcCD ATPase subunit
LKNQEYKTKREFLNEFNINKKNTIANLSAEKEQAKTRIDDALAKQKELKKKSKTIAKDIEELSKQAEAMEDAVDVLRGLKEQGIQSKGEIARIDEQLERDGSLVKEIEACRKQIEEYTVKKTEIMDKLEELDQHVIDTAPLELESIDIRKIIAMLSYRLDGIIEKIKFYENNDSCDSCGQEIDSEFKERILRELTSERDEIKKQADDGNKRLKEISDILKESNARDTEIKKYKDAISDIESKIKVAEDKITYLEEERKHISENGITEDVYSALEKELGEIAQNIEKLESECTGYEEIKKNLESAKHALTLNEQAISLAKKDLEHYKAIRANLREKIKEIKQKECSISEKDIQEIREVIKDLTNQITEKKQILYYFDLIQKMLKDDGVKTVIIEEFLPIINGTVNMYLDKFDFPIQFMFDSKFSETISSFNRNDFTYYSFSEGEKARIDLSILFTWRDIAIRKARSATNILIFDEVFDGSMDVDGIENFMNILGINTGEYSPFVITHDEDVKTTNFPRILEFSKNGHFTMLTES